MEIKKRVKINASADKVWDVLWNNYGQVCNWASTVNHSDIREVKGNKNGGRTCHSAWGQISEIVKNVDEKNKSYTYYADGLPSMMKSAVNSWKVVSLSDGTSEVQMDLKIEIAPIQKALMGWMIVPKMKKDIQQTVDDLKYFIEEGKPSPVKVKTDEKFFKKNPDLAA